ncbi:hypothetical protein JXA88_04575 [Candidatus Fermentibacteria bacterium]|nr:hypothetical protein [Candidatus Fermentibacteria bacterium]
MPTTIIRCEKSRDHPYVMIDRRVAEDPTLSWKAKGLMSYLLSRPDDWQIRVADLVKRSPDGETAVRSGLRELEQRGYLVAEQLHDPATGRFTGIRLTVYEQPLPPDEGNDPGRPGPTGTPDRVTGPSHRGDAGRPVQADLPAAGPPAQVCRPADRAQAPLDEPARPCAHAALPPTALPTVEPPRVGPPHGEIPNPANHALLNTDLTKTERTKKDDVDDVPPLPPRAPPGNSQDGPTGDPVLAQVVALYEQEIGGTLTAMIHDELTDLVAHECQDLERWRAAFRASIGARNRWHYTRAVILHPERRPPKEASPYDRQQRRSNPYPTAGRQRGQPYGYTLPSPEEIERVNREAAAELAKLEDEPLRCDEPLGAGDAPAGP